MNLMPSNMPEWRDATNGREYLEELWHKLDVFPAERAEFAELFNKADDAGGMGHDMVAGGMAVPAFGGTFHGLARRVMSKDDLARGTFHETLMQTGSPRAHRGE